MNATELGLKVSNYETVRNIYMNFSVNNTGVWGLPEGSKTQHLLNNERLEEYRSFLEYAIVHYTNMVAFFNNDYDLTKKLKKYNLYLKRLNNAMSKVTETIPVNTLTIEEVTENWTYDEDNDIYWIDTESHGSIMYIPSDNIFIVHEGTKQEYETNIQEVSKIVKEDN